MAYTNVNGLQSALVEINDYLRVERSDVMGITETKLTEVIEENKIREGEYNIWVRNRAEKQGGSVMLLVKKDLVAYELRNDYGLAEVVGAEVVCRGGVKRDFVVVYALPKTNSWNTEDFKKKMEDTKRWKEYLMETKEKLVMMGDFNSKEVKWDDSDGMVVKIHGVESCYEWQWKTH
ncbi:hypothetical protein E2C01_093026 [Portunus trituberculatus]|uniref:Endonuclease/exonuclease/phosphatase domain-containing protein n=1 Tax=Portunus trituberculatus TaxID=210409 RepID=A0A5B7JLS7_PORTR|nr:hypothetical protein [Portunus trituberculatus]